MFQFETPMMIEPYLHEGVWVFDSKRKGFKQERIEAPGTELTKLFGYSFIDQLVKNIPNAENGFMLFISSQPIPGYQVILTHVKDDMEGVAYKVKGKELYWWFGFAFECYFSVPPETLYVKAEPYCSIHGTLEFKALKDRVEELEEWVERLSKSVRNMEFERRRWFNLSRN